MPVNGPMEDVLKQSGDDVLLGDVRALARSVGGEPLRAGCLATSGGLGTLPASPAEWAAWAGRYVREVVVSEEWPAVLQAWSHASTGRVKELLELDRAWGGRVGNRPLAEASFRAGQRQLNRLRPLRDARVVQRYLDAVAQGRAHGWHPMVYGVMLAVFGLPLRQGLMHYADQVLGGLVEGRPCFSGEADVACREVVEDVGAMLVPALGRLMPPMVPLVVG